jgi:hypothetical protein
VPDKCFGSDRGSARLDGGIVRDGRIVELVMHAMLVSEAGVDAAVDDGACSRCLGFHWGILGFTGGLQ